MLNNYEYLEKFVKKHDYKPTFRVQCFRQVDIDSIKYIIFDEEDVPSMKKISMDDIRYDIDSSYPKDVFLRYVEFLDKYDGEDEISFIYWMTKMDNKYEPIGIDKTESEKMKKIIYDKIEEIKKIKWF